MIYFHNLHIIIGDFNQSIDKLPRHLEELTLIGSFDKSVDSLPVDLVTFSVEGLLFISNFITCGLCKPTNIIFYK
jgi:hypothetical protein